MNYLRRPSPPWVRGERPAIRDANPSRARPRPAFSVRKERLVRRLALLLIAVPLAIASPSLANTSHDGWPKLTGILMMNKLDQSRTLDARIPGASPSVVHHLAGVAPLVLSVPVHNYVSKTNQGYAGSNARPTWLGHNELLGGHGSDTIWAGPMGDVIWGDYKPSGQPDNQVDRLHGGAGDDYIYASHGLNYIWTGAGNDHLQLVYGHGIVDCNGSGLKTLVMRKLASNRPWKLVGCKHTYIVGFAA
jgi:RTX calcium-binding nonapeptide repeat (4 copies)